MDYSASPDSASGPATRPRLTLPGILLYEQVDRVSGWVLVAMLVFSPWAFGTTQTWSILVMNMAGCLTGLLLGVKLFIRYRLGHRPARWGQVMGASAAQPRFSLTVMLGVGTCMLLVYCTVSALNARADYDPIRLTIKYRDYVRWLPHSYDRMATWEVFAQCLAWAGSFWGLRDWLLGMTPEESRMAKAGQLATGSLPAVPSRLGLLLWIIVVNGALLGIEGILQRLEGSGNLLFLVKPRINPGADSQFGPFAYRSNAAQYLNLIWPVALGFWWWLQRAGAKRRRGSHHWLLLCATVMAACPIISTSRAGALTSFALLLMAAGVLISGKRTDGLAKLAVLGVFGLALAGGAWLGWQSLNPRLNELGAGYRERELMYKTARVIADEHPVFGTGPGTFEHVFQLYRQSLDEYWPKQLHNDWLELLLTFGWVGFAMILVALGLIIAHGFRTKGIPASRRFIWLIWLALGGCLLQARWDFPFRVYSVVFLFLALCAVLTTLAKAPRGR